MDEIFGRYRILNEIGHGGFATVYSAHDTELDRAVAIKELKSSLLRDANWTKRFQREARAVARLDHPHIITIYDVIQQDQCFVIVMRLVNGPSLDRLIAERGRLLLWPETLEYFAAIASGLDYAHSQNILHRDLKPANILIDPERGPVLSDFGLAKLIDSTKSSVTESGSVVGTPHYIAPEIWEEKEATPQTDIYALGCILYEMLTGDKAFKGDTPPAVMMAHFKPLQLPRAWPAGTPPAVADVLRIALAARPNDRYPTAAKMVEALTALTPTDLPTLATPLETPVALTPPDSGEGADYGNMKELVRQVTQEVVAETRREQAAMWQHEAETSLSTGQFDSAERAARKWQELNPTDPAVAAFWQQWQQQKKLAEESQACLIPFHATPTPQPGLNPKKKKKLGCLRWPIGLAIVLLALIGVGTVCTQSHTFKTTLSSLPIGQTVSDPINVPLPDTPGEPVNLLIHFTRGSLFIKPGATESLVNGTATYNIASIKPQTVTKRDQIIIEHENPLNLGNIFNAAVKNQWDLQLGNAPMALELKNDIATGLIELGGLPLTKLTARQDASNFEFSFNQPNPVEMNELRFESDASNVTFKNLANANARSIFINGGAGNIALNFGGQLTRDTDVHLEFGLGAITLTVPKGTPARVSFASEQSHEDITMSGDWQKSGETYIMPGAGPALTIMVDMGPGSLTLNNP